MKFRKFFSILPLFGGILTLIGLFVPSWYSITSFEENVWMVGIIEHILGSESIFDFMPIDFILPNIVSTIIISIISVILIISTYFYLKEKEFRIKFRWIWLMMGVLEIITMLSYIYLFDITFSDYLVRTNYPITSFWNIYNFNFGLIIPFIGGSLAILGVFTNKKE